MDPLALEIVLLKKLEAKVDRNAHKIDQLSEGLATHKAKTSRTSLIMGAFASLLVAIGAVLLKGCV